MMILAAGMIAWPDKFVLIGYFVLMLGIGAYFYRYMRGMKDYFTGGNVIPWWLSGVSFYMASFSAFAFVFYSSLAYKYGFVAITLFWVTVPATMISVIFFSKRWRRARIDSPVEYLESRYSTTIRQLFAWHGIPVRIIDDSLKLIATGTFLSVGLGLDLTQSMFWSGVIMLAYTFMGGLWAVAVTDFVQFVVLAAAVVVLLPLAVAKAGGAATFLSSSPAGFFRLTSPEYPWKYVICQVLLYSIAYSSINWSLIQRYFCVPKERDAYKVGWLVVVLNLVGTPIMFLPAMAARQFLPALGNEGQVYPMLCAALLPVGMMGLMIAAMFSATMSTLSSDYNVCANVLTIDVYRRLIHPKASQRELVLVGRFMTLLVGVLSLGLAFVLAATGKGEQQFRNMVTLFSIATAPVGIPMLAGLLSKRTTNAGALAGFLAGVAVGIAMFIHYPNEFTFLGSVWKRENLLLLATTLATLAAMTAFNFLLPSGPAMRERIATFLARLKTPIGQLPEDTISAPATGEKVVSPFRVVGMCNILIGGMMLVILPFSGSLMAARMNLLIGAGLVVVGALMTWLGRSKKAAAYEENVR